MIRCNACMEFIKEEEIIQDPNAPEIEYCPNCNVSGCLMDLTDADLDVQKAKRPPLTIESPNWELLKKQKADLLIAITLMEESDHLGIAECLTGLLHLIDNLQDTAVASGLMTEEEVFNLEEV